MTYARSRGFTITDLLVAMVVAMVAMGFFASCSQRNRSASNTVWCGSHLKQIGQGLLLYANENNGNYPRTRWNTHSATVAQYTAAAADNPFLAPDLADNDVTAAMFLLLRTQELTSSVFICPSDSGVAWDFDGSSADHRSNFPSGTYLSYSLENCYPGPAAVKDGFRWTNTLNADFAVAADMNPGTPDVLTVNLSSTPQQLQRANSPNHQHSGQEVLYGDGHVEYQQTCFAGVNQDNIYGVGRKAANGVTVDPIAYAIAAPPAHKDDSVLLPIAIGKAPVPAPPVPTFLSYIRGYTYISLLAFIAIVTGFVLAVRKRDHAPDPAA